MELESHHNKLESRMVSPTLRRTLGFLSIWFAILAAVLLLSIFIHESGHGIGAKLDGIHVSTGFNKVGMPDRTPADPDFRTGIMDGIWTGLLGPVTTWLLAIIATVTLYRLRAGWGALAAGAFAVANGLSRAIPMSQFVLAGIGGHIHLEDEVTWGVWYAIKVCHPELGPMDWNGMVELTNTRPELFLSEPAVWLPPLLSLVISLACLGFASRQLFKLFNETLAEWRIRLIFVALSLATWFVILPVLTVLDRMIRINW